MMCEGSLEMYPNVKLLAPLHDEHIIMSVTVIISKRSTLLFLDVSSLFEYIILRLNRLKFEFRMIALHSEP